ncbi:DUF6463 family protein [Modestobacter sp. I12A-02662]|uniref:DUF6463 family protein n=1 Tax=Modestobacter sp. I12A-02662 TaxID=1730496 RepID=UPI0034DE496C
MELSRTTAGRLTMAGGLLAVGGGAGHTMISAAMRRNVWDQIVADGVVGAISLEPTPDQLAAAEAFWFSPGSFGVPLTLLGSLVVWSTRQGHRVPGSVGWGLAAWAAIIGVLGRFDAGSGLLLLTGALIGVGGRRPGRSAPTDAVAAHAGVHLAR